MAQSARYVGAGRLTRGRRLQQHQRDARLGADHSADALNVIALYLRFSAWLWRIVEAPLGPSY